MIKARMINLFKGILRLSSIAALLLCLFPERQAALSAPALTYNVSDFTDSVDDCVANFTLRCAILAANANPGADTVILPAGTYNLTLVGDDEDQSATGDLDITDDLTLTGAGAATTIIDGDSLGDRIFTITETVAVTISNLTIQYGAVPLDDILGGGGILNYHGTLNLYNVTLQDNTAAFGAGISNALGVLKISGCKILNNGDSGTSEGGGVYSDGNLEIYTSEISHNRARFGAGVSGTEKANMIFSEVVFDGNVAEYNGGAILNDKFVKMSDSTLKNNQADLGAGLFNKYLGELEYVTINNNIADDQGGGIYTEDGSSLSLKNITLSSNQAGNQGGGISNNGEMTISNVTIYQNQAPVGGNLYNDLHGLVNVGSSIVAGGIPNNCSNVETSITSLGFNLEDHNTCSFTATGDKRNTYPLLLSLADNGGKTYTHELMFNSPAIDAGNPYNCILTDQRHYYRPVDGDINNTPICDIGAYEIVPSGFVKFNPTTYETDEGPGSREITLTVSRYDANTSVSVEYVTLGIPRYDFVYEKGILSWSAGDTADKTFTITILDDNFDEGEETVLVLLTNMKGGVGAKYPLNLAQIIVHASDTGSGETEPPDIFLPLVFR
jgi:predicted outer membrane repeat protein